MSDYSSYDEAIQAILDAQNDVDGKYKSIGNASSTLCDVNQTMLQIPDGSVVRNRGGEVIGYDYKYTTPKLPDTGIMAVDSNTDSGAFGESEGGGGHTSGGGAGRYRGSYYAGEVVDDPQSTDKMKGSGLVSGVVGAGWAAASVLAKLGKSVASVTADVLERVDAHFGLNYGPLNVDFGYGTADMANAVRALFGVDNQGNTTMYLEEDVIGALAIQTKEDGFFNSGEVEVEFPEHTTGTVQFTSYGLTLPQLYGYARSQAQTFAQCDSVDDSAVISTINDLASRYSNYFCSIDYFPASSLQLGTGYCTVEVIDADLGSYNVGGNYACRKRLRFEFLSTITTNPDSRVLTFFAPGSISEYSNWYPNVGRVPRGNYETLYSPNSSIHISPSVPGVSDQTGATIPVDAITGADPHVVAQNLESQYPSVMGTPVQIVVMDDSCNPVTKKYFSVPISYSPTNLNIGAPITGGLQVSPSFNPDVQLDLPDIDMDNYIDQIIKILGGSGAGRDVTVEPIPEDDPDAPSDTIPSSGVNYEPPTTGTGDTPPTTDPTVSVESMWHIYHALPAQLSAFGQWLWSANVVDQIIRMFVDPMQAIMGVHAIYCQPNIGSQVPIVVGYLTSTANAFELTSQYQAVDCGSVWLTEYFGNVFDYDPYTEVSLYLPFIGIVKLNTADVMRAKIGIVYGVDCYTGACLAKVSVTRDGAGGVLYEFPGNCAVEYPISGASYSALIQSIAAAGMTALKVGMRTGGAPGTGALGAAAAGLSFMASGEKFSVAQSGSLGGNAGVFGAKIPYLIVSRPQPNTAELFPHYQGFPVNTTVTISECSGYQRFSSVHLKCPYAYKEELDEIESLLKSGILI